MIDHEQDKIKKEESIEKHRADLRIVSDRVSESYCSVLKKGREKKGLSTYDIAQELKIPSYIIIALEEQQYDKLPSDTYVAGYIRAYSDLLGLNPEGLIKDFKQDKAYRIRGEQERLEKELQEKEKIEEQSAPRFDKSVKQFLKNINDFRKENGPVIFIAIALLLIAAYMFVSFFNQQQHKKPPLENALLESVKIQNADGSIVVADIRDEGKHTSLANGDAAINEDRLKFVFSGTSWVTVRDDDGNMLHQSREQKGEVLEVSGHAPFFVRLSKASAVNMKLNGKDYDFSHDITDDDQLLELKVSPE